MAYGDSLSDDLNPQEPPMADRSDRTRRSSRQTKDRVLQARIPGDLDEQLRNRAEQLGISVSTVVRNVLLHTFDLVEGVVTDSAELARVVQGRGSAASHKESTPQNAIDQEVAVIGWQQATLNRNGVCDHCNTILVKGELAAVGVPVQVRPILLCRGCLENLSADGNPGAGMPAPKSAKPAQEPSSDRNNNSDSN